MNFKDVPPAGPPASPSLKPRPKPRPRILVVEDDVDIRRLNSEVLIDSGYLVATAKDGAQAWDALQLVHYDLLITDNGMPGLSGVEVLKKIHAAGMKLPVIMATGTMPTWEFSVYPWLHPAAVLLKPYHVAELLETVRNILGADNPAPSDFVTLWAQRFGYLLPRRVNKAGMGGRSPSP